MMKRAGICIIFSFLALFAYSETYFIDSEEVRTLRRLYTLEGIVFPMNAYPVNGSDLLEAAQKLPSPVTEKDRNALDSLIQKFCGQRDAKFLLEGALAVSYEHHFRTSLVYADPSPVKNGLDFQRAYLLSDPFLSLGTGGGAFTGVNIEAEVYVRQQWEYDYAPVNNFFFPSPDNTFAINFNVLNRGVLAWNSEHLDISIGRDQAHFGNTPGASLYPSLALPYMDAVRLSVPIGRFSMDYMLASIEPRRAKEESGIALGDYFGFMLDEVQTAIFSAAHLFHWNFGKVKAGIGANVVYARSNNMLTITDILPVSIFHNDDMRPNNLTFTLDCSWAFCPGFTLSFMLGFDDINGNAIGIGDTSIPTIPAGILQLEYVFTAPPLAADFLFEAGYTHYLWGNYAYYDLPNNGEDWGNVYLEKAVYRYADRDHGMLLPLTSPYGPGTIWGRLKGDLAFSGFPLRVGADLLLLSKIKAANLVTTPYERDDALEKSARSFYAALDLPCAYTWRGFSFTITPSLVVCDGEAAFECTLGAHYRLGGALSL
ncbi:MAG: hypothetical protein LBR16_04680 [Treponema sp.]|nr:hypothetical protein [Treponema sp.]